MDEGENDGQRHSLAQDADLITDPVRLAEAEARNGLRQFDMAMEMVEYFLQPGYRFKLRISQILSLHRAALEGISRYAGNFRPGDVEIQGSLHQPVKAHLVPELIEDMCDYVNGNWEEKSAFHLAAYMMWRLNWVHPFADGNGRTSRILSYLVLCLRLGHRLPGRHTIPEQISENRAPYFTALDAADAAWRNGTLDLSAMETLLENLLAEQLFEVVVQAKGSAAANPSEPD